MSCSPSTWQRWNVITTSSTLTINQYQYQCHQQQKGSKSFARGSMQRSRGMGRPQQRELPSTDLVGAPQDTSACNTPTAATTGHTQSQVQPPRPTRNNSKLKVLVRSHAMREETSPPREPTPAITVQTGPVEPEPCASAAATVLVCNHTPSSPTSPITNNPCLIVSPMSGSPPSSPINHSPLSLSSSSSTVRTQDALNSAIARKLHNDCEDDQVVCDKVMISNDSSPMQTSINTVDNNTLFNCDCFTQNCVKCLSKINERNLNNNSNNINNNNVVNNVITHTNASGNTLTVSRANPKHKLRQQSSSQGSFEGSSSTSPCLSRDNSTEHYKDTTGIDLTQFILETLNKNAKDRVMMLKIEHELVTLAKDKTKTHFKFPPMSSYQRMLVHRTAAFFGMDHNIEVSGKCVVVNKTKNTRIPEMRFKDHIREDLLFPEEPRRSILKRDSNSFEDCNYKSPDRQFDNRRSKSFEEREEEYEKARRRIFKDGSMQDCNSQEDFNWAEMPWPDSDCSKIRLLPPEPQQNVKQSRLLKVQSVDGKSETLRPCMAKSYSFGGYGGAVSVLTRGDSITSTHSAGPRLLTKQDSSTSTISWRLSPSSSGYKSQSQRSDSVTPSPTATPHQLSDASGKNYLEGVDPIHQSITEETVEQAQQTDLAIETTTGNDGNNQLVWAVTDMQSVPKGSVLIDPQTGHALTNQDGTIYHFDPSNPPPGFTSSKPPPSPPKVATPQKSPIKERSPSPKKLPKLKTSPLKNKSCLINSSTSPSLPMTPPIVQNQTNLNSLTYSGSGMPMENPANIALQPYPVYPNGFVSSNVPAETTVPVYQPPLGMVYTTPYGLPPQYENRPDTSVTDLSGYFVNMAVSDPTCASQSVGYQHQTSGYWGQQPVTYYQQPPQQTNQQPHQHQQPPQQQRYPVQIPVAAQTQPSGYYPPNYVPVTPNHAPVAQNSDLVPVYTNPPMQMVYSGQQSNVQNPVYIQNPSPVVYTQNAMFQPPQASIYTMNNLNNTAYSGNNQCYSSANFAQNLTGFDHRGHNHHQLQQHQQQQQHRTTPKSNINSNNKQCVVQKLQTFAQSQQQSSNPSTGGSNSPANTVIAGYFPNSQTPISYRQCTPPETPPTQNIGYGYPPNYVPHSVIFRPLGGIRASPPVNLRSSRSPTPAPEYPQVASVDRNQRYSVPAVYHGMPCIVPGEMNMRLVAGRAQAPVYRQPYRQQSVSQSVNESNSSGRSHKVRKPRTKVPALPPSGRQSNQSIQANSQQRF